MTQRRLFRWRVTAAAVASGVALAGAPASAALADAALTGDLRCYPQGASIFECLVGVAGGTAPYTMAWSGATFTEAVTGAASGTCTPSKAYTVTVVITDAAGAQVSDLAHFICKGGPPV